MGTKLDLAPALLAALYRLLYACDNEDGFNPNLEGESHRASEHARKLIKRAEKELADTENLSVEVGLKDSGSDFAKNDLAIIKKLRSFSAADISNIIKVANDHEYDGEDCGILVDVLYSLFPEHPISVHDEYDSDCTTASSITIVENWCNNVINTNSYGFPTQYEVVKLQEKYPSGTKIKLDFMPDPHPIPTGTTGTIIDVTNEGQINVKWDCNGGLSLIAGIDQFSVIK